jgi:hypothetical protein
MLIFAPLFGAAGAISVAVMVIRMVVGLVMKVVAYLIEQLLQEIIEELAGNEDMFDELGVDEFWRRHNWWIEEDVQQMAEEGATEDEIIAFAEEQSQAAVDSITKTWVAEPGGSLSGTCRYCRDLDGTTVPIRDIFAVTSYGVLTAPPRHPNCQCRISISF